MRGNSFQLLLSIPFLFFPISLLVAEPLPGPVDSVSIAPGGDWIEGEQTNLAFDPERNRLLTVVREKSLVRDDKDKSDHYFNVLSFDMSTLGLAAKALLNTTGQVKILGTVVSPASKVLYVNCDDSSVSGGHPERSCPIGLEEFDLETFSSVSTDRIPYRFHQVTLDTKRNRLLGIAEVSSSAEYQVMAIDLTSGHPIAASHSTGMATTGFIAKGAVYSATVDSLLVFFQPTIDGNENEVDGFGRVYTFDAGSGIFGASSEPVIGEFPFNPLALSPDGKLVAVISKNSTQRNPIFMTSSFETFDTLPRDDEISSEFWILGGGAFANNQEIWIPNDAESVPKQSIAVYDLAEKSTRFIEGASRSQYLVADPDLGRVFIASRELQSLYVLDSSATEVTTQLDVSVLPADMDVDSGQGFFHILANAGRVYLVADAPPEVSDGTPHLVSRLSEVSDLGSVVEVAQGEPSRGLLFDANGEQLLARRHYKSPPRVFETQGYQPLTVEMSPAEVFALDSTLNRLYTLGPVSDKGMETRQLQELNSNTFEVLRTIDSISACTNEPAAVGMEVEPDTGKLWVLIPKQSSFCFRKASSPPNLRVYGLSDPATLEREYSFLNARRVGDLVLDTERNRALVSVESATLSLSTSILTFTFGSDPLEPSGEILLPTDTVMMDRIYDVAEDLEHDLLYYLTFYRQTSEYFLAGLDLRSDTFEGVWDLGFLDKSTVARIGFDPVSNRFAAVSAPDSIVYLFDNPVSPTRRPPPTVIPSGKTAAGGVTGSFGQTIAGIELDWEVGPMFADRIDGWSVERREDPDLGLRPSAEWINLTPVQLPADLSHWTDTTADRGSSYLYRTRPITDGTLAAKPLDLGPVVSYPDSRQWVGTIPEVAVFMAPNSTRELLIAVETLDRRLQPVTITASSTDPQLEVSVSPRQIPIPGASRLFLSCADGTPPGSYAATVTVSDDEATQTVSTIVQVPRPGQRILTERILRAPTQITLLSDSDLDQKRMSVRGQLGIQRHLASPTNVIVKALLPTGETLSASGGVVAPTGEFTAEFAVPATSPPGEEWFVRATWKGSLDAVGGNSVPFNLPVFTNSSKNLGPELPQSSGSVLLVQGLPPKGDTPDDLAGKRNKGHRNLIRRRFSAKENTLASEAIPSTTVVFDAMESMKSGPYYLAYFLGDATVDHPEGFAFRLNESEVLTPGDFADLVNSGPNEAVPFLVLDCPYAAACQDQINHDYGAYIFTARKDWGDVFFRQGEDVFMDGFIAKLEYGFGEAYRKARRRFSVSPNGGDPRLPQETRAYVSPYRLWPIGSRYGDPNDSVDDVIPPDIFGLPPTTLEKAGTVANLYVHTLDAPFDGEVSLQVEAQLPDGSFFGPFPLRKRRSEEPHGGEIHEGTLELKQAGQTVLIYSATDEAGNQSLLFSSLVVTGEGLDAVAVGPTYLVETLQKSEDPDLVDYRFGSIVTRLFELVTNWYLDMQQ